MIKRAFFSAALVALSVGACGGGQPAADASSVDSTSEAASSDGEESAPAEPALAWADMNRDQRMEFMGLTVMPEMKKVFQGADPEGYKDFKCQTCHGEDMQKVDYKMPNGLFALTKPDPMPDALEYDAKTTKFMADEVQPKMAALLGAEPGTTFTCFSCHDAEE
jgi:hypothetical protein